METKDYKDEPFIEKSKYKGLKIFLLLLLIAGIAYGGYYYYVNYYNNPTTKVNNIITTINEKLSSKFDNQILNTDKTYEINGLIKLGIVSEDKSNTDLNDLFDMITNLQIGINGQIDNKNNINNINISSKYKDDKLIDAKIYTENNKMYVKSEQLYNKFIYLDEIEDLTNKFKDEVQISDINELMKSLVNAVTKNLDSTKLETGKENITVDNKNIDANKYKITLKGKEINDFIANILTSLKNDQKFTNIIKKIDKDALNTIDDMIKDVKEQEENQNTTYEISFYTKNDALNEDLISIRQTINVENKTLYLNIDLHDENTYLINMKMDDVDLSIKLVANNKIFNFDLNTEVEGIKLNLSMNFNYEEISAITKEDISNSVKMDELTEEDSMTINQNIEKNATLQKVAKEILEKISKIMPTENTVTEGA